MPVKQINNNNLKKNVLTNEMDQEYVSLDLLFLFGLQIELTAFNATSSVLL